MTTPIHVNRSNEIRITRHTRILLADLMNTFDDLDHQTAIITTTEISGKDLAITKENDRVVIGFAYNKEVPIAGPVFLLIKYEGRSQVAGRVTQ